jgi:hypothetical protein
MRHRRARRDAVADYTGATLLELAEYAKMFISAISAISAIYGRDLDARLGT